MRISNLRIEKEQILLQTLLGIAAVLLLVFGVSSLYTAWDGAPLPRVQPDLNSVAATEPATLPEKEAAEESRPSKAAEEAEPTAAGGETAAEQPAEVQPATPAATA